MPDAFVYRLVFLAAGCYNLTFALWLYVSPDSLFALAGITVPFPAILLLPLSIGIAGFVPVYVYAACYPERAYTWIGLCMLAKLVSCAATLCLILFAGWPADLLRMTFFNDMIWMLPFALFLQTSQ